MSNCWLWPCFHGPAQSVGIMFSSVFTLGPARDVIQMLGCGPFGFAHDFNRDIFALVSRDADFCMEVCHCMPDWALVTTRTGSQAV